MFCHTHTHQRPMITFIMSCKKLLIGKAIWLKGRKRTNEASATRSFMIFTECTIDHAHTTVPTVSFHLYGLYFISVCIFSFIYFSFFHLIATLLMFNFFYSQRLHRLSWDIKTILLSLCFWFDLISFWIHNRNSSLYSVA